MLRIAHFLLPLFITAAILLSCTDDDSFSSSPNNRLTFSADTVSMDTVFSTVPTSTRTFWVYNKSGDGIRCANVRLAQGNQNGFRVNVDGVYLSGTSGYQTSNVEIRNKDSIRVFVELTAPMNGKETPQLIEDDIIFTLESGVEQKMPLKAYTWDAQMMRDVRISQDMTMDGNGRPIVIYGGLRVDSMVTLKIQAGTTLYFHADAGIDVYGTLISEGTPEENVVMRGDRTDRMFDYLPYDRVSGQWQGIRLHEASYGNMLNYTDVHSTFNGIVCDSSDVEKPKLRMYGSIVHNCQGYGIKSVNSKIDVINSQISNTLDDCVAVIGGDATLTNCTLAQFYPFDAGRGAALRYANSDDMPLLRMDCINSIVTGYADDVIMAVGKDKDDKLNYRFISSLLRTKKVENDENIINVIWEDVEDMKDDEDAVTGDKNFKLVDIDMQKYNFGLAENSPAIDNADPAFAPATDRNGLGRDDKPDMGAFEFVQEDVPEHKVKGF